MSWFRNEGPKSVVEAVGMRGRFVEEAAKAGLSVPFTYPKSVDEAMKLLDVRDAAHKKPTITQQHGPLMVSGLSHATLTATGGGYYIRTYPTTPAEWDNWCDVNGIPRPVKG